MFTHRHVFGETGEDQPINYILISECWQDHKNQFPQVFSEPKFPIKSDSSVYFEYRIKLQDKGALPPHYKIYPLDQDELTELKKQITDMLSKNQIGLSDSPYGAPILFTKNIDGCFRICIDYRVLNTNNIVDSYPLPHIDELHSRL